METFERNMRSWLITNLNIYIYKNKVYDHLLSPFLFFCFQVVFFKQKQQICLTDFFLKKQHIIIITFISVSHYVLKVLLKKF